MATILVVDDRPIDRDLLVTLLGYYGYRLLEATDGAEALQIAHAEHPDLIISDILMPTMDGYEFVRQLRADAVLANTAVIFYTANYLEREALAAARDCGVAHILSKPCEPDEVLRTVEAALNLSSAAPTLPTTHGAEPDPVRIPPDQVAQRITDLMIDKLRLLALIEFRQRLAVERTPERLLEGFCQAARDLIGAKLAAVGVLSDDGQAWHHCFISGVRQADAAGLTLPPPQQSPLGLLLEQRQPLRLPAPGTDLQAANFLARLYPEIRAFLGVPLVSAHRSYGWLCLIDKLGVESFTEADELLATMLATEVAMAYENATLNEALQRYAEELVQEVRERQRAEAALQESAGRLADLSRQLLAVQEEERRHLARELHDEIGQLLTGIKLSLEACRRQPDDAMRLQLGQAQAAVNDLIGRVREMSLHLRPAMLDDFGLLPTLLWHLERYTAQTRVRIKLEHTGMDRRFAPEVETAAYRIVQEALTNIARHAAVHEATVRLGVHADTLVADIEDRGVGFPSESILAAGQTRGLAGMRERARLLGGRLTVKSVSRRGTSVHAELPLHPDARRSLRQID